jgi:thymidylate synthase ThyX
MKQEKMRWQKTKYQYRTKKDITFLGREKEMKEEKEDQKKLLRLKAGYFQHTSLLLHPT